MDLYLAVFGSLFPKTELYMSSFGFSCKVFGLTFICLCFSFGQGLGFELRATTGAAPPALYAPSISPMGSAAFARFDLGLRFFFPLPPESLGL
jgi:hypothetical protein